MLRPFFVDASKVDAATLLNDWRWLVPPSETPLFLSAMGDWVFGAPDGSLWLLSMLEGSYTKIAQDSIDYNRLNKSQEWLEDTFLSGWFNIAVANEIKPNEEECLGWKVHPRVGGKFEVANLQTYSMLVYQSLMGQLHRQLQQRSEATVEKKPWFKLW